ncbi:hypothetical protein KFK09_003033 [Dendrobium nobile]|uniref:Uncharacterized protein n=1 Tax=Dendrobium nobile TaxID=94219 RepID=A0A8T3C8X7_DENNO|nr:hypothetical protein KFK09_003033 [Dendrobium nobile]
MRTVLLDSLLTLILFHSLLWLLLLPTLDLVFVLAAQNFLGFPPDSASSSSFYCYFLEGFG